MSLAFATAAAAGAAVAADQTASRLFVSRVCLITPQRPRKNCHFSRFIQRFTDIWLNNGDIAAVKKLLNEAAVFNQTDIVFILMDSGENLEYKNGQGETPLDCAPATLQYKMKMKMQESGAVDQRI
ncbi:hypothetical protein MTR_5g081760 [Medicago truncatula]|uniref:Uncharacterized protein n=1 Tax=Medicago truncatula TaxID=3880 RepID=G7KBW1_MEDTR|nr:hypothetical protein MTR_5g081760 [Medicago truncatula]